MAWIELHQTLPTNQKTIYLMRLLGIDTYAAVGYLCLLWLWAMDGAPDGDVSKLNSKELAKIAGWKGRDHERFLEALICVGFIDPNMHIHDWEDYAGRLMEQREAKREQSRIRKQKQREREKGVKEGTAPRSGPIASGQAEEKDSPSLGCLGEDTAEKLIKTNLRFGYPFSPAMQEYAREHDIELDSNASPHSPPLVIPGGILLDESNAKSPSNEVGGTAEQ